MNDIKENKESNDPNNIQRRTTNRRYSKPLINLEELDINNTRERTGSLSKLVRSFKKLFQSNTQGDSNILKNTMPDNESISHHCRQISQTTVQRQKEELIGKQALFAKRGIAHESLTNNYEHVLNKNLELRDEAKNISWDLLKKNPNYWAFFRQYCQHTFYGGCIDFIESVDEYKTIENNYQRCLAAQLIIDNFLSETNSMVDDLYEDDFEIPNNGNVIKDIQSSSILSILAIFSNNPSNPPFDLFNSIQDELTTIIQNRTFLNFQKSGILALCFLNINLADSPNQPIKLPPINSIPEEDKEIIDKTDKYKNITLYQVLANPTYRKIFQEFAEKSYCGESIHFLDVVDQYRSIKSIKQRAALAPAIMGFFIGDKTQTPINISSTAIKETTKKFNESKDEMPLSLFDECYENVFQMLLFDVYPRFYQEEILENTMKVREKSSSIISSVKS